jgi:hypothetical protein
MVLAGLCRFNRLLKNTLSQRERVGVRAIILVKYFLLSPHPPPSRGQALGFSRREKGKDFFSSLLKQQVPRKRKPKDLKCLRAQ